MSSIRFGAGLGMCLGVLPGAYYYYQADKYNKMSNILEKNRDLRFIVIYNDYKRYHKNACICLVGFPAIGVLGSATHYGLKHLYKAEPKTQKTFATLTIIALSAILALHQKQKRSHVD